MLSKKQEAIIRQQALLMMWRNQGKEHIVQRVYKRFKKCINNG